MKYILYILFINIIFINSLNSQCAEPDAEIWKDTWRSCTKTTNPITSYGNSHWILYDLGSVRNLSKSWVWNTNDPDRLNQGFQEVKIDYSLDGEEWTHWGDMIFPKANGNPIYGGFSGPDLSNISALYILITAISNYGDESCFGIAEIKFNLLPETGESIDEDDDEELDCADFFEIEIGDWVEVEVEMTEAFIFIQAPEELEELSVVFEYRVSGGVWKEIEFEEEEIEIYDLNPGTTYEYRFKIECEDENYTSPSGSFETIDCQAVSEVFIEEITESEAFFFWEEMEYFEFYIVEIGIAGEEEKEIFEVEEAELFLEDLDEDTSYELRIGIECGENILWSEVIIFKTLMEELISQVKDLNTNLTVSQVRLFPNPTTGSLTMRVKSSSNDVLNYALSTIDGQVLIRNLTKISEGATDLRLDVSELSNGTYFLSGVSINSRAKFYAKIIKVSQ